MAIYAELWCAFEELVGVALGTGRIRVLSDQLEGRLLVIERGRLPPGRRVAPGTLPKRTLVRVVLAVAIHTHRRSALENLVGMTFGARHVNMQACEFKSGLAVVERGWFPAIGRMALGAVSAQSAVVRVVLAMAICTALWGALERFVGVAFVTRHVCMQADELEDGLRVIEGGLFPILRRMAFGAVAAQSPVVRVVVAMTIRALLRYTLENIVDVAFHTLDIHVFAR